MRTNPKRPESKIEEREDQMGRIMITPEKEQKDKQQKIEKSWKDVEYLQHQNLSSQRDKGMIETWRPSSIYSLLFLRFPRFSCFYIYDCRYYKTALFSMGYRWNFFILFYKEWLLSKIYLILIIDV